MKSAISGLAGLNVFGKNTSAQPPSDAAASSSCDTTLSPSCILQNLPGHISTLSRQGAWHPVSRGRTEFFKSIDDSNFVQWVNEFVHVQDRVIVLKAVDDCRAHEMEKCADFRPLNVSGDKNIPLWLEMRCVPIVSDNCMLTIMRDISERKTMELDMAENRKLADQSNTAKSRFLANMSHELRTPLNAIIGFSDLLKSGMIAIDDTQKQQEYQELINESAHHLLHVLNDILDMSKIEAGKYEIFPEEFDLVSLIHSTCSMLMPLAQKSSVRLNVSVEDDEIMLEADSKAVRQIILNLVSNSIKFADADTVIEISASRIGRKIELKVADRGRGISPEYLDGLGNPFYQVDNEKSRQHEGAGLGLSIVKGLVNLHNGDFNIESTIGVGTNVRITLAQSMRDTVPVPADDAETIIRIKPRTGGHTQNAIVKSRLVG